MTLGMRVRLWIQNSPRNEVTRAAVLGALAVIGLGVLAMPTGGDESGLPSAVSAGATALPVTTPGAPATGGDGDAGGAQLPATPSVDGQPTSPAGPAGADPSGGPAIDGAVASGGSAAPVEAPAASETGVSADEVRVGFLVAQLGGLDTTGFALGLRDDQDEVITAFVDAANASGGIHGRKIVPVIVRSDPLNASSMRAACTRLADDEKVFAAVDSAATIGSAMECFTEKRLIHLSGSSVTVDDGFFARAGGYQIGTGSSETRALLNWASLQIEAGWIGPGKGKLGLFTNDCPPDPEVIDGVLKPFLKENGVDFVEARVACDLNSSQQQVPSAVLRLRQAGADRVFLATQFYSAQSFVQTADAQGWRPKYSTSDVWGLTFDFATRNMPRDAFNGTRSFTYSYSGAARAGVPLSPGQQRCDKALKDAGLTGITDPTGADSEAVAHCDGLEVLRLAAARAPVNFTDADWIAAVQAVDDFQPSLTHTSRYGAGKFTGGDSYAVVEWKGDCSCWVQVTPHSPAKY